jgi:hypothetical protein
LNIAEKSVKTRIEISTDASGDLCDQKSIYYGRSAIDVLIKSTTKFDRVAIFSRVGFWLGGLGKSPQSIVVSHYHGQRR